MNLIIPMAGRGCRFANAGISTPKPLIDVLGRPMYSWAVESLPIRSAKRLIFICLREHLSNTDLRRDIEDRYASYKPQIVALDEVTQGQACTVLTARDRMDPDAPLIIFNADTWFRSPLEQTLATIAPTVAGMLGVFRAPGDRWSFARTDATGRVVETAEKRRISDWACTGLYHFSRACDFLEYADQMIRRDQRVNGEFYVAPVYNQMIQEGRDIRLDIADEAAALGTPEDLAAFLQHRRTT